MTPYLFVIVPLALYLALFSYETYASLRRLKRPGKRGNAYLHATWEVTHTIMIIGVTNFIWLFSSVAVHLSRAIYWGLIIAGFCFIVRAILYVYLFYIRQTNNKRRIGVLDWLFALTHLGVLAGLTVAIIQALRVLDQQPFVINEQFIPWLWPGLVVVLGVGLVPLAHLYRTKDLP